MMNKKDVKEFFDNLAPEWEINLVKNDSKINTILDYAGVDYGKRILDVACGTGVLFPYYMERGVSSITGVDISEKMIEIASEKYGNHSEIELIADDVENISLSNMYDCCIVYNAFPHFVDPQLLIECLAENLTKNGRLTIAHGMSREKIDRHHSGAASKVSRGLMSIKELTGLMVSKFNVDVKISNDAMYVVSGIKM